MKTVPAQANARDGLTAGQALYERLHALMPDWYPDEWVDLMPKYQIAYSEAAAASSAAQADALDEEQRDALNEAICWANDDGLPGTADQLRSILALHAQADAPVRTEALRKGLFEARDAMRVMSNRVKELDPAGYSWGIHIVHRANAVLNGEADTAQADAPAEARLTDAEAGMLTLIVNYGCALVAGRQDEADAVFDRIRETVCAPADAGSGDAIARSKRILALVDDYHEKPTADSRTTLRQALMAEFETAPPAARVASLTDAARDVLSERFRQVEQEGWTPTHEWNDRAALSACAAALMDEQRVFALAAKHDGFGDRKHFDFTGTELLEFARDLLNGADHA
ncbi:hypothetical protein [Burkholderia ubonensis]|uniref:hypothetical protein n=1 Tax=Burkholderia ubonensis TaxID=101571 RepID=UPI00076CAF81|nr:hypothetical protein [Burkholderia ubonensis]KVV07358.1 hypothetical protein WK77_16345 [Burkholderia ubonensis]